MARGHGGGGYSTHRIFPRAFKLAAPTASGTIVIALESPFGPGTVFEIVSGSGSFELTGNVLKLKNVPALGALYIERIRARSADGIYSVTDNVSIAVVPAALADRLPGDVTITVPDVPVTPDPPSVPVGALTFNDNTPLQFADGSYLEFAA